MRMRKDYPAVNPVFSVQQSKVCDEVLVLDIRCTSMWNQFLENRVVSFLKIEAF